MIDHEDRGVRWEPGGVGEVGDEPDRQLPHPTHSHHQDILLMSIHVLMYPCMYILCMTCVCLCVSFKTCGPDSSLLDLACEWRTPPGVLKGHPGG